MIFKSIIHCLAVVVVFVPVISGCVSPGRIDSDIVARYQRAMAARGPQPRDDKVELGLMEPAERVTGPALKVVEDPNTQRQAVHLTLEEAVRKALANNMEVRVASFDPAVSYEAMVQAAAAFDMTVFGETTYTDTDNQTSSAFAGGEANNTLYQVGVKQYTLTGADWSLTHSLNRDWDNSTFETMPVRWSTDVTLMGTQPLLRNAWTDFTMAKLRIARIDRDINAQKFRQTVEQVVSDVINSYWSLVEARKDVVIQEALLAETIRTLERIRARAELDATAVQIKQAEVAVETRRAVLIRAQKNVKDVEQQLEQLLADSQLNVLSNLEIIPATEPLVGEVTVRDDDQLLAALRHSPQLEQARLAIRSAEVTVKLAKNQVLPKLDARGSIGLQGLDSNAGAAYDNMGTGNYLSFSAGLVFEYPLGNREALAGLRTAQLQKQQAIATLQNTADKIALNIRERIRQIHTSATEVKVQRLAVVAAERQLEALNEIEKIRGQLTPEFLQVKLTAQQTLATARQAEQAAIANYNRSIADLARITGTILDINQVTLALPNIIAED